MWTLQCLRLSYLAMADRTIQLGETTRITEPIERLLKMTASPTSRTTAFSAVLMLAALISACGGGSNALPVAEPEPPTPVLQLVAGSLARDSTACGTKDGNGSEARFTDVYAMTVGPDGTIYVIERNTSSLNPSCPRLDVPLLRAITPEGVVRTLARGDVPADNQPLKSFARPTGIAADFNGNVFVSDGHTGAVFATPGYPVFPAGQGAGVWKVAKDGTVSIFAGVVGGSAGQHVDGTGTQARFVQASAIFVDRSGALHVSDRVARRISPQGVVTTVPDAPLTIAADTSGNTYTRTTNGLVQVETGKTLANPFGYSGTLAISASGHVYGASQYSARVERVSGTGVVTPIVGSGYSGNVLPLGPLHPVGAIAVGPKNQVYIFNGYGLQVVNGLPE